MKSISTLRSFFNLRASICVVLLCGVAVVAHADMITVTNTDDSGPGSLRQALIDANDGDTINFAVTGTIGLTGSDLVIDKSITISGPGPDMLAVSRFSNAFRIFHVMPGRTVSLDGLAISNGYAPFDIGGGILNDQATLTLRDCSVVSNMASNGGGIYNADGSLTIIDSSISNNGAGGGQTAFGGGIYNNTTAEALTIVNTTISGNSSTSGFPFTLGVGGGILGAGTIINCTIDGNYAGHDGGGIAGGGTITNSTISNNRAGGGENNRPGTGGGISGGGTITNCTISGNSVFGSQFKGPGRGGGIYGTVTISNSTISENSVGFYGNGGGIYSLDAVITNTIVGNNSATMGENIYNGATSLGYNVCSDDCGLRGPGDLMNTAPLLGPLQDNGGPTQTYALLPGSPAIDAGNPNFAPPPFYDQRGPDFWRLRNNRIDIGSFEVQTGAKVTPTPTPTPTPTLRPIPTPRSQPAPPPRPTPR
jgi:hypothetical protein